MKVNDLIALAQLGLLCAKQLDTETIEESLREGGVSSAEDVGSEITRIASEISSAEEIESLIIDELCNHQMDSLRNVLRLDPESNADDYLYSLVHNYCRSQLEEGRVHLNVFPYQLTEEVLNQIHLSLLPYHLR